MATTTTTTKQIKTFQAACKVKGVDPSEVLPDVSAFPKNHQKALIAAAKLFIIAEVLNAGWTPDWNNADQYKYYPWFDMEKTSSNKSGFRLYHVGFDFTFSAVGSRLCFRSREIAEYAAEQFLDLYKDYMVL